MKKKPNFKLTPSRKLFWILFVFALFTICSNVSADEWVDGNCQSRMKLTFDNSASSQTLEDFPVPIKLNTSRINYSKTSATDIRFYDGMTLLSKETEDWNGTGDSFIWVKVPQMDDSDTDYIYAYFDCSDTDADDAENVWNSSYVMIHHFQETAGDHFDSTSNNNDGVPGDGVEEKKPDMDAVGIADGADDFDGSNDCVAVAHDNSLNFGTGDFTISIWIKYGPNNNDTDILRKGNMTSAPQANYKIEVLNDKISATLQGSNPGGGGTIATSETYSDNNWHNAVFMRQSGATSLYVDGVLKGTDSTAGIDLTNTANMGIGSKDGCEDDHFDGTIDEVRFSTIARGEDWIKAACQAARDELITYGSEETAGEMLLTVSSPQETTYLTTTIPLEGSTNINADISYSLDEGSSVPAGTDTQSFSTNLSGLSYDSHTIVVTAEDSSDPSNTDSATINFTVAEPDAWADTECLYRKMITFDNRASDDPLDNFPVLIKLNPTRIDYGKATETDIRFYDDSTLLPKETEDWNNASGESFIWVKVPQVDDTDTDYIYAYYGCKDTNGDDAANVWDSNYMMVHHLQETETEGDHLDSTSNSNDGVPGGGLDQDAVGIADGADDFDGSDDCIAVAHDNSLNFGTGDFTISAWVKYGPNNNDSDILRKGNLQPGTAPEANYKLELNGNKFSGVLQGSNPGGGGTVTTAATHSDNLWHNAVFLRDSGTIYLYIDGELETSAAGAGIDLTNTAGMGIGSKDGCADDHIKGILDEIRISNTARNADWIQASYLSTKDQFVSFGSEETASCLWDYDGDGVVDGYDLWRFLEDYVAGTVNADDLTDFANEFGRTDCP